MFSNYLKVTLRFLLKSKTNSIINIAGLALGTLCCLYILLYLKKEYGYDRHHQQAEQLYRVTTRFGMKNDPGKTMATCSPPIAPAMKNDFPEIEQFTRAVGTIGLSQHILRYKDKSFFEKDALFVDSTFFDVFTWHFTNGNSNKVLVEPYSVVLLKPVADKLFGNEDPVGKMIEIDNSYGRKNFRVTGVVDASAGDSHIRANLFMTMNSGGIGDFVRSNNTWSGNNFTMSYVKLKSSADAALLQDKLPAFIEKYGAEQLKNSGREKTLLLQPVSTIHTTPGYEAESAKTVSKSFLYVLLLIAILIQVIACINFMNLATARAAKRAKEVGVRKVIGAERSDLVKQFLGESLLLSFISVLIALPLLLVLLPYLNRLTDTDIQLSVFQDYRLWLTVIGLSLVTGLLAGSYPALYLSAFNVVRVIKGNFTNRISAAGIRRSLVVFQFVLAIVMITGIIVIYHQLSYIRNKDLGFESRQKMVFSFHTRDTKEKMSAFMNDLAELSEVKSVSRANNYPSQFVFNDISVFLAGGNSTTAKSVQFINTDEHFVKTADVHIISGRDFIAGDSGKVIVNESFIKALSLDPAIVAGSTIYVNGETTADAQKLVVVGVMRDMNLGSLHEEVKPFMLSYDIGPQLSHILVAINTPDYKELLGKMKTTWDKSMSGTPFEYKFLDDEVARLYEEDIALARIINSFTAMAILISCLGLFGLAAFSAEQRAKEIGIRKILGASFMTVTTLLSKDFLQLVAIALLIAIPIGWIVMHKWLEGFAYRTTISWWMFAIAGVAAMLIALLTVSFQAIRAAVANPVHALRSE